MALAIFFATACGASETTIVLSVTANGDLPPIHRLRLTLSNGPASELKLYPQSAATIPIGFPATLAIVLPSSRSGVLDIAIDGMNANGVVMASGDLSLPISAGRRTNASVALHAGLSLCGNSTVDVGEGCDDGNRVSGDGCDFHCQGEAPTDGGADSLIDRAESAVDRASDGVLGSAGAGGSGGIKGSDGGGEIDSGGAAGTAALCAGAEFCDDFEAASAGGLPPAWTQTGGAPGDWNVAQATDAANSTRVLAQSSTTAESRFIYTNRTGAPTAPWDGAVTVTADVKALAFAANTGTNRAVWICPRHAHLTDFYCLALVPGPGAQVVVEMQTNQGSVGANGVAFGVPVTIGSWCHVEVRIAANGTMTGTVNDTVIPAFSPSTPLTSGYAAVGTQGAAAAFDNIVVRRQ